MKHNCHNQIAHVSLDQLLLLAVFADRRWHSVGRDGLDTPVAGQGARPFDSPPTQSVDLSR